MEGLVPSDIILHIINVAITFILLRIILWKPLFRILETRRLRVEKELSDASEERAKASQLRSDYEQKLDDIAAQGRELIAKAQTKADEQASSVITDARAEASRLLADAHTRIEDERRRAVSAARRDIASLAGQLAGSVLHREVGENDDISAVENFFGDSK